MKIEVKELPWKSWGAGLLAVLTVIFFLNRSHKALDNALRDAEAARLAMSHQIVEVQASKGDLERDKKDLLEQNEVLREAYETAMKAAPDAEVVSASSLDTGPMAVQHAPRPPRAETPVVDHSAPAKPELASGSATEAAADTCALHDKDQISARVDILELRTQKTNTLVVGVVQIYRLPDRLILAHGGFQSSLAKSAELAAPAEPRWGAEVAGLCTRDGCGLGAGVLLPPGRFLGLRWEPRVTAYSGPVLGVAGALGVRW